MTERTNRRHALPTFTSHPQNSGNVRVYQRGTRSVTLLSKTHLIYLLFAFVALGCGGGGGGSGAAGGGGGNGGTPNTPPTPSPSQIDITGNVLLGPLANADVSIRSPGDEISLQTTTDASGAFGPVSIDGSFTGPLEIVVSGNATASYVCDGRSGCLDDAGNIIDFGDPVPFTGAMRLLLASPEDAGESVTVTPFSHAAAARADALGGVTAENVRSAHAEMQALVGELVAILDPNATIDRDYFQLPPIDLTQAPSETPTDTERVGGLVSLLGSALFKAGVISSSDPDLNADEILDFLAAGFQDSGDLPLSTTTRNVISLERVYKGVVSTTFDWQRQTDFGDPLAQALADASGVPFQTMLDQARDTANEVPEIDGPPGDIFFVITPDLLGTEPLASAQLVLPDGVTFDRLGIDHASDELDVALRQDGDLVFRRLPARILGHRSARLFFRAGSVLRHPRRSQVLFCRGHL